MTHMWINEQIQYWLIVDWNLRKKLQVHLSLNVYNFIQEWATEKVSSKVLTICPGPIIQPTIYRYIIVCRMKYADGFVFYVFCGM